MKIFVLIQHENLNTMTSPTCVFYLTCLFWGEMVQTTHQNFSSSVPQASRFLSVQTGGNLTLLCFHGSVVVARFYWYKQTLGEKPRLMCTFYMYDTKVTFHAEFKNPRFTLDVGTSKNLLRIRDLQVSDSATYYCASSSLYNFDFMEGIVVSVKGSGLSVPVLVHQSASETIQPGGSVTLNCTVHTGTCDGQHSVYWFKDSEESHAGLIYTHGDRNHQCERKPSTQTHTCSYNLPMKSLTLSHAGTYYCAVASCGHVLFGDGTKLDIKGELHSVLWVNLLSGALTFTTILSVLLVFLLCRNRCECTESHARCPTPITTNAEGEQNEENIHYAVVKGTKVNRSRRQRNNAETECIYSSIKQ